MVICRLSVRQPPREVGRWQIAVAHKLRHPAHEDSIETASVSSGIVLRKNAIAFGSDRSAHGPCVVCRLCCAIHIAQEVRDTNERALVIGRWSGVRGAVVDLASIRIPEVSLSPVE